MLKIYLTLLLLSSCTLFQKREPEKKKTEKPAAQGFLFENKIIHPECVMPLQDMSSVDLNKCRPKSTIVVEEKGITTYHPKNQGMAQYKVIGNPSKDEFLIRYLWNGGGSGFFSGIQLVGLKVSGLHLIKDFNLGGDRCNGGVLTQESPSKDLRILQNMTPIDFLESSQTGRSLKLESYEDLEASATSCYAQLVYAPFKEKGKLALELLGIKTLEIGDKNTDIQTRHSLQGCFDVQFNKLRASKKDQLLQKKDLEDFARNFKKACL